MRVKTRMEVPLKFRVFWDVTPCGIAETYRRSGWTYCPSLFRVESLYGKNLKFSAKISYSLC
jgi:hypothetical protein